MRRWRHWHGIVGWAFVTNQSNQEGLGGVAGNDDGAIHATTQKARTRRNAQVAAMIEAAVAAIAVVLEDGLDALRIKRDRAGSGI